MFGILMAVRNLQNASLLSQWLYKARATLDSLLPRCLAGEGSVYHLFRIDSVVLARTHLSRGEAGRPGTSPHLKHKLGVRIN